MIAKTRFLSSISRELFNKWQAERWWAENYEKVMELYNVQQFNSEAFPLPPSPPLSEDEVSFEHRTNRDISRSFEMVKITFVMFAVWNDKCNTFSRAPRLNLPKTALLLDI